jgi:hypothetical protein
MDEEKTTQTIDDAFEGVDGGEHKIGDAGEAGATSAEAIEKSWSDYGLSEDFNGMSREQIAQKIKEHQHRDKVYGRQADEVGTLRTEKTELENKLRAIIKEPAVKQEIADMTDGEKADFFATLERNPRKAIQSLMGDNRRSDDDLQKMIDDRVNETLQGYHDWAGGQNVVANNPEYARHTEYVEFLSKPEYLGPQRSKRDIYELAELLEQNKTLGDLTYNMLKEYPSMNFAKAKKYADLELTAKKSATDATEEIKEKVAGVDGAIKKPAKKAASKAEKIESMDDAFDLD